MGQGNKRYNNRMRVISYRNYFFLTILHTSVGPIPGNGEEKKE
jgi:hypothetical protein